MSTIDPIDLAKIPAHLIEPVSVIMERPFFANTRKHLPLQLLDFLQTLFEQPIEAQYVVVANGFAPHKDVTGRQCGYNYILEPGGDRVLTTLWDDDLKPVHQIVCEPKIWYRLPCCEWHSVHNIQADRFRIMISVTYQHDKRPGGGGYHPLVKDAQQWLQLANQRIY